MANRIFFNPKGYIEVQIEGDQTYMSFQNIQPDALTMLDKLQKEGKKRLGMIDTANQGKFSPDSNRAAMNILESLNYDRLAIICLNTVVAEVTNAIILAMGKTENTKVFPDRASAEAWLLEA